MMAESMATVIPIDNQDIRNSLKNIKICCVSHVPFHLVSHLKAQVEYLRDLGMNVVLVSSAGPELSKIKLGFGLSHEAVEIPRLLKPWKDLMALIRLTNIFFKHKFDIVHSTTPKAGLLSSIAAFLAQVPVRLHTWTGQQWIMLHGPLRWFCRFADKLIGNLNIRCYADSKSQRQFLVDERIIVSNKIGVIGYGSLAGVDLNRFDPGRWLLSEKQQLRQELSISPDSRVIIFVGRITRDKGVLELIAVFHELLRLDYDADLLLVGPFDQECGGKSSIDFIDKDPSQRIHYLGYIEHPERYLSIADIFCLPSYREGFGTTVIEAAAMGIPTVGTHINGLVDAVVDNETGILVPPYNEEALLEAIKKLLNNPSLLHQMGKAARQRCIQLFDANVVNKKLAEEYIRILKVSQR
jgi:glycosyltransferase involved in cell wall biosynthesis